MFLDNCISDVAEIVSKHRSGSKLAVLQKIITHGIFPGKDVYIPLSSVRKGDKNMILETERLILRPWKATDAESLYKYAKDSAVGPIAGWQVHTSVENSREIIRDILSAEETYAVVLKDTKEPIGSIGLMIGEKSNFTIASDEGEIGYWIGVPYWGQGMIPEAVRELMKYGFEELNLETIWCGAVEGNYKSRRVQEKCGFRYHHTEDKVSLLMNDVRTENITCITRQQWELGKHER